MIQLGKIWLIQVTKNRLLRISQIWLITSVKNNCFNSEKYFSLVNPWKLTGLTKEIFFFIDESVKSQISGNLTDSVLDSMLCVYGSSQNCLLLFPPRFPLPSEYLSAKNSSYFKSDKIGLSRNTTIMISE